MSAVHCTSAVFLFGGIAYTVLTLCRACPDAAIHCRGVCVQVIHVNAMLQYLLFIAGKRLTLNPLCMFNGVISSTAVPGCNTDYKFSEGGLPSSF